MIAVRDLPYPNEGYEIEIERGFPIPTRDVWYIETIDGRLISWENCQFIVVFEDKFERWNRNDEQIFNEQEEKFRENWVSAALLRHELI